MRRPQAARDLILTASATEQDIFGKVFSARTEEGSAFAQVRLAASPTKNFSTAAYMLGVPVWAIFLISFWYPVGFVFTAILFVQAWVGSARIARVEVVGGSWWAANRATLWAIMKEELFVLMFMGLSAATASGILLPAGFTLAALVPIFNIRKRVSSANFESWIEAAVRNLEKEAATPMFRKGLKVIEVPDLPLVGRDTLEAARARMKADVDGLSDLKTFDASQPELVMAWQKSSTPHIERYLKEGDDQTRAAWEQAIGVFNTAKDDVDLARGGLRQGLNIAEKALAPYAIDIDALVIEQSATLDGRMAFARVAPKTFTQRLQFDRGMTNVATKVATGNLPWQAAIGFAVFSGVMMWVNHSKLMRQLKELEGKLVEQAAAIRGDIGLIENELRLRLIPQFDGLTDLFERLDDRRAELVTAETTKGVGGAKAEAMHLAFAVREARYLLEMKAGN